MADIQKEMIALEVTAKLVHHCWSVSHHLWRIKLENIKDSSDQKNLGV